ATLEDFVLRTVTKLPSFTDNTRGIVFDLISRYSSPGCLLLFLNVPHNMFRVAVRAESRLKANFDRIDSDFMNPPIKQARVTVKPDLATIKSTWQGLNSCRWNPSVWSRIPGSTCLITNSRIHLPAREFLDPPTESAGRTPSNIRKITIISINAPHSQRIETHAQTSKVYLNECSTNVEQVRGEWQQSVTSD
ncbi:hypothetical protein WN51_13388, partial [Melipona quadrifasciata]